MHRRLWILWLMLALLPLRGWAVVTMALPAAASAAALEHRAAERNTEPSTAHAASAQMPCHLPAGDANEDAPDSTPCSACTLCDLCHSAVAMQSLPTLTCPLRADTAPRTVVARDTGRNAVGGLERPPRTHWA